MAWTRNRTLFAAAGAAIAGLAAALFARRRWAGRDTEARDAPALDSRKAEPGPVGHSGAARSAGPAAMRDPPKRWDHVDQAVDESFPASDPAPVAPHID